MRRNAVVTSDASEDYHGDLKTLGNVVVPLSKVLENYYVGEAMLGKWHYLKELHNEKRAKKAADGSVFTYNYLEALMVFPDSLSKLVQTILTGEDGSGVSRI